MPACAVSFEFQKCGNFRSVGFAGVGDVSDVGVSDVTLTLTLTLNPNPEP